MCSKHRHRNRLVAKFFCLVPSEVCWHCSCCLLSVAGGGAERIFVTGRGLSAEGKGVEGSKDRGASKVVAPSLSGAGGGRQNSVCAERHEGILAQRATVGGSSDRGAASLREVVGRGAGHRGERRSKVRHGFFNFLCRSCNLRRWGGGELERVCRTKAGGGE